VPRTALIVVVPEAEPLVREWRRRYDNASLGVPAHVTLLFPFVSAEQVNDALLIELEDLFASRLRFSFSLPRVARFPDVAWLVPEPDDPFRELMELIFERYPDYPPYEGMHDELMPHLTVAIGDEATHEQVEAALTPHLPINAEAREITLLVEDGSGHWQAGHRFPLKGGAVGPPGCQSG
jgi:2'-5' RNA ligase